MSAQAVSYSAARESHPPFHRAHRAARADRRPWRARQQPAVVVAPARPRTCSPRSTRSAGRRPARPDEAARRALPEELTRSPRTPTSSPGSARRPPTWTITSPSRAGTSRVRGGAAQRSRYFSPEFGITEVLPQYSGGLGILAGDHLKSACDLGVPIVGVGLLYRHGLLQAVAVPGGLAAGDLPGPRPRRPAAGPAARAGRPPGDVRSACPAAGPLHGAHLEGPGRPGAAAAARLRRRGQRRRGPRDHRPALRRRRRAPAAAGDAARHRRRPGAARLVAG